MADRGLDTGGVVFDSLHRHLERAGLVQVTRHELLLPIGEWGGPVGALMATDFRTAFMGVCEVLRAHGSIGLEESHDLLRRMHEEYEQRHVTSPIAIAYGRKPHR